ncbi:unnamed protein product [Ixodes hexagonus]
MKTALPLLVLVALSMICILVTSLPACVPCSEVQCGPSGFDCQCGNYTTHCACCHRCFKCSGEVCKPRLRDICNSGYECSLESVPNDDPDFDVFGTCTYIPTTRAPRGYQRSPEE